MVELTVETLQRATGSTREDAEKYLPFLKGTCKAYDITTPRRVTGFLSQIGVESQNLSTIEENLNYSVEALLSKFGRHRITETECHLYGRKPGQPANRQMIANLIYGGPWGLKELGNKNPGDGWRYRGRGLKQLTGLDNYARCGHALREDFVSQPERLLMPVNAALSAGWFWASKNLNALADKGDIRALTKEVNGGYNGLEQRIALWYTALGVFA